jgi:hypothetical protein
MLALSKLRREFVEPSLTLTSLSGLVCFTRPRDEDRVLEAEQRHEPLFDGNVLAGRVHEGNRTMRGIADSDALAEQLTLNPIQITTWKSRTGPRIFLARTAPQRRNRLSI